MTRRAEKRFRAWVARNGGKLLEAKGCYEFARFVAADELCIVYRDRHGAVSRFVGKMAGTAWRAFSEGQALALGNTPTDGPPKNIWRDRAKALAAIIEVRAGREPGIAVRRFARAHNLTARFLVGFGISNGLVWRRPMLVRAVAAGEAL